MKLDSDHLEILAVIVEKGGLTEGAEALGKSQPSVSRTIAFLQDRVGMPLFEPGRRPLRPTELGQSLARIGAQIRSLNHEASQLLTRYRAGHAGRLRIGGTPIFMDGVISTMVADFHTHEPDVQIDQSYGYLDELLTQLRNGALDLAIAPLSPSMTPKDMEFTPVLAGRNVVACRASHPLIRRGAITMDDIRPYQWISPPENSPLYLDLQLALRSIGQENFRVNFSGGSLASILSVLVGSDSLTVLPYSVVFVSRKTMGIDALPVKIEHPARRLGIIRPKDRSGPPSVAQFASFLTSELARLQARMDHEQQVTRRRG